MRTKIVYKNTENSRLVLLIYMLIFITNSNAIITLHYIYEYHIITNRL